MQKYSNAEMFIDICQKINMENNLLNKNVNEMKKEISYIMKDLNTFHFKFVFEDKVYKINSDKEKMSGDDADHFKTINFKVKEGNEEVTVKSASLQSDLLAFLLSEAATEKEDDYSDMLVEPSYV